MSPYPEHDEQLIALKRIEGQVRGIQKMIQDNKYCIDILTQIQAIKGAISRVEDKVLRRHIEGCVVNALKGKSEVEKQNKINEVVFLLSRFRKT